MNTSRRAVIAMLGSTALLPVVAGEAFGQAQSAGDRALASLARRWLDQSMRLSPVSATQIGDHRFDTRLDDMSARGRAAGLRFAKQTLRALDAIDQTTLSRANQVDAALLSNALKAQIWTTEVVQEWAWNPLNYQNVAGGAVYNLMARAFAPVALRLEAATRRMELMPALLAQARAELVPARVPAPHAATYALQNKGLKSIIGEMIDPQKDQLSGARRTRLDRAILTYNAAVDAHQTWIEQTLTPAAQADFRAGAARFDQQLAFTLQSTLTRADIRQRAETAIVQVRAQMYEISRQVLAGRPGAPPTPSAPTPAQQQAAIGFAVNLAAAERPARDKLVRCRTTSGASDASGVPRGHETRDRPSRRTLANASLLDRIRVHHTASRGTYGAVRIRRDLMDERPAQRVGRHRVARLMRSNGIAGVTRRRNQKTTIRGAENSNASDLVDRNFHAEQPNQLWVADITYIPTWAGFLYLSVVLDAWSRRIIGWSMQTTLATRVVLDALDMAVAQRRPENVVHHSDHGCQYTSLAFGKRCREVGVGQVSKCV